MNGDDLVAEDNSWWTWLTGETGEAYDYTINAVGDVYDSVTGELIGVYDETTDAIYAGGEVIAEGVTGLYDDAKDAASAVVRTVDAGIATTDKALNIASVVLFLGVGLGAYIFLRPYLK